MKNEIQNCMVYSPVDNPLMRIERVAAYVRVSTQEQKLHGLSLDAQRMKLTEYAEKHHMKIVEWYVDEGVSGRKLIRNRPELQRMIQDAEKRMFDHIIFIKLDRFFRSVAEYHECMKRISPVIWSTTEEEYDLTTANGRMLVNMKLTIAEMEADQTGERINIVNEYKVSTGQPLTGSMPFGFKIETDETTGRKKIIKHPEQKEIMDDLLKYVFKHQSKNKAVSYLKISHNISMTYNSLSNLLKNTLLYGEYRGNPNYCEGYLTKAEFDRLQLITRRNVKNNTVKRDYIFSGILKCPVCGSRLAGYVSQTTSTSGKIHKFKKYRCCNSKINRRCSFNKAVSENILEKQMFARIEGFLKDEKVQSASIQDSDTVTLPEHDVEEINTQIDRLNYSWQTGKIRKVEQYEEQYEKLMEKLSEAESEQHKVVLKDFSKIEGILHTGWKEIYKNLDDAHKRAFWRSFVDTVEIHWTTDIKEIVRVKFF